MVGMKFTFSGFIELRDDSVKDVDAMRLEIADALHRGVKTAFPTQRRTMNINVEKPAAPPGPLEETTTAGKPS